MAFMGVRMSWDMFERKALLAALALLAASRASSKRARRFISSRVCTSTLRKPSTMSRLSFQSPVRTAVAWQYSTSSPR